MLIQSEKHISLFKATIKDFALLLHHVLLTIDK